MPRLRRDYNASAPSGDDIAELFEHERRPLQVDFKDRRRSRLRWGDAGCMD